MGHTRITEIYDYIYDDYTGEEIKANDLCVIFRPHQDVSVGFYIKAFEGVLRIKSYPRNNIVLTDKECCFKVIHTNNPAFKHLSVYKE